MGKNEHHEKFIRVIRYMKEAVSVIKYAARFSNPATSPTMENVFDP